MKPKLRTFSQTAAEIEAPPDAAFLSTPPDKPHQGNYYSMRKLSTGLWTVHCITVDTGGEQTYRPTVTAPDLAALTFMKLIRIYEQEYTR